jgi:hypothetical protein
VTEFVSEEKRRPQVLAEVRQDERPRFGARGTVRRDVGPLSLGRVHVHAALVEEPLEPVAILRTERFDGREDVFANVLVGEFRRVTLDERSARVPGPEFVDAEATTAASRWIRWWRSRRRSSVVSSLRASCAYSSSRLFLTRASAMVSSAATSAAGDSVGDSTERIPSRSSASPSAAAVQSSGVS